MVRRLGLAESGTAGKAFLAALEGDFALQAGPVWEHQLDADNERLTILAEGMGSYFARRVILPYPTIDPVSADADTRFSAVVTDPEDPGYPWPVDTRKSYQGIIRAYLEQATEWPSGDVPIILPDEIPGDRERWEKGANLAPVWDRISALTGILGGPDVRFAPRLTSDKGGVEWPVLIGTPTQPQLYSAQDVVFNVGVKGSSVSNLKYRVSGSSLASTVFTSGGRGTDTTLISTATDSTLLDAGYPLLERVDSSHSTVSEIGTLNGYATEAAKRGRTPIVSMSFDHDTSQRPYVGSFNVGDFASVRVKNNPYLPDGTIRMRITALSGDAVGQKVHVELQPEVS